MLCKNAVVMEFEIDVGHHQTQFYPNDKRENIKYTMYSNLSLFSTKTQTRCKCDEYTKPIDT
jgi:hypothetical protein